MYILYKQVTCPRCDGDRYVEGPPICKICGAEVPYDWYLLRTLPCGHPTVRVAFAETNVEDAYLCPECGGLGYVNREVGSMSGQIVFLVDGGGEA